MGPLKLIDTSDFRIKSDKNKHYVKTCGHLSARLVHCLWNIYWGGRTVQKKWKEKWNTLVQRCFYSYQVLPLSKYLIEEENAPELICFAAFPNFVQFMKVRYSYSKRALGWCYEPTFIRLVSCSKVRHTSYCGCWGLGWWGISRWRLEWMFASAPPAVCEFAQRACRC